MKILKTFSLALLAAGAMTMSTSCAGNGAATTTAADSTAKCAVATSNGQIAFVRMDSLMTGYGLYIDLSTAFGKKQEKAQKELESKGRALETEVRDFSEKAQKGLITTYQAQTKQAELQKKEQQIMTYRDNKLRELAEEEAAISAQISAAILDYLNEFNAEKKYSVIFQTMGGSPIILADPALDITAEVLGVLNSRYEKTLGETK